MTSTTKQVQVPHDFFRKSKTEYRDWRSAFVRELVQNCYDALATTIKFMTRMDGDYCILSCIDDGTGMDRDTLENVLLCLGGTRKPNGAVGGFGYAKSILFFAHHDYTIRTNDLCVNGIGGDYTIESGFEAVKGTQISVRLDDAGCLALAWDRIITEYVGDCFMEYATGRGVEISLNGKVLEQNNRSYEVYVDTAVGSVWYDMIRGQGCDSCFVVSVNGLPMFKEVMFYDSENIKLHGGIDLVGGSKDLTANRDGFAFDLRRQVTQVISDLISKSTAQFYGNAVDMSLNYSKPNLMLPSEVMPIETSARKNLVTQDTSTEEEVNTYLDAISRIDQTLYPQNFHVKVESLAARGSAKTEAYLTASKLSNLMNLQRTAKLALRWKAVVYAVLMCQHSLEQGVRFIRQDGTRIDDWEAFEGNVMELVPVFENSRVDIGIVLIEGIQAMCTKGDNLARIMFNPLLLTDDRGYQTLDMIDLAFHEVAHLWQTSHTDAFMHKEHDLRHSFRRWMVEKDALQWIKDAS